MLRQLVVGIAISSLNVGLHALGTIMLDRAVQRYWGEDLEENPMLQRFLLMIGVGTGLMVAHFIEVVVWAFFYDLLSVSPRGNDAARRLRPTTGCCSDPSPRPTAYCCSAGRRR